MKLIQGVLTILFVVLVLFGPALLIYSYLNPGLNMPDILSAGSTYALALLTIGYVLTTSRQLDVMSDQLDEAKRYRELQNQPLPWLDEINIIVEKPRLYFSPRSGNHEAFDYVFIPKYRVSYRLKNLGSSPSINTDISTNIIIPSEGDNTNQIDEIERDNKHLLSHLLSLFSRSRARPENGPLVFGTVTKRIGALEPGASYPSDTKQQISNTISDDHKALFLDSIRNTSPIKLPCLSLRIIYKNVIGGCFVIDNAFLVHPMDVKQDAIIAKWITSVMSFSVNYKDEIASLKKFEKSNSEKGNALFAELKEKLSKSTAEDEIELALRPIDHACEVKAISTDQYNTLIKKLSRGMPLPPKACYQPPCLEEKARE